MVNASSTEDIQSFIDRFRHALQNADAGDKKELARLFAEYSGHCENANRRLRECHLLVQRGQYSNAVAASEQEPNLLTLCGLLEIPERESLAEIAQTSGIKPPPPLNLELAEILQIAYEKSGTVASNMARLHRLTLARAPLPARLAVMRQLLIQNPNHPFMDADIRAFEKHWFKQAQQFAAAWAAKGRPEVVQEVYRDLLESGYMETPPATLVANLQNQVEQIQAAQLPPLAEQIRRHFQQKSLEPLKLCARQWNELAAGPGAAEAAKRHGVAAALAWVQQSLDADSAREQRQEARARLVALLAQSGGGRAELKEAYESLQKLRGLDRDLEQKYNARMAKFGRRRAMVLAGCAIGVAALIALAAFQVLNSGPSDDSGAATEKLIADLTRLIDAGNYDLALRQIEAAPGPSASNAEVATLKQKAELARQAWEEACRGLEACPPDGDIKPLLEKARSLAKNSTARGRIYDLERAWRRSRTDGKEKDQREFELQVAKLRTEVRELAEKARAARPADELPLALRDAQDRLAALRRDAQKAGFDERALNEVEQTAVMADRRVQVSNRLGQLGVELKTVNEDASKLERIASCLTDALAPLSPDETWARQARKAKPSLTNWKSALQLGASLQSSGRIDELRQASWKDPPLLEVFNAASNCSDMFRQRRIDEPESAAAEFKEKMSAPDIRELYFLRRKYEEQAKTFYCNSDPEGSGSRFIAVLRNRKGETERIRFNDPIEHGLAPQSKFAKRMLAFLSNPPDSPDWQSGIAKHYQDLREMERMDPISKLRLIRDTLELAAKTSVGYRRLLESSPDYAATVAAARDAEQVDWIDESQDLDAERKKANSAIDRAPRLDAERAIADDAKLERIKRGLLLVGWLARDAEGRIGLAPFKDRQPTGGSRLYTVVESAWNDIGVYEAAGAKLKPALDQFLGWPVFAVYVFANPSP